MTEYKIEKGIQMPAARGAEAKYPFGEMEVGDSFYVEGKKGAAMSASIQAFTHKNKLLNRDFNKVFACRSDVKGVRVWRTK